jgi:hypothetical protein
MAVGHHRLTGKQHCMSGKQDSMAAGQHARLTFIFPWQADRIPRQKIRTARLADFAQAIGEAGERREKKFDERVGSAR